MTEEKRRAKPIKGPKVKVSDTTMLKKQPMPVTKNN
jgi:hypothetical protein